MSSEPAAPHVDASTSAALREARGRRADLHAVMVELERSAAAPASGRHHEWCERVHDAVVEVGAAFERHIAATEGPGGLFEEVTGDAPRLAGQVTRLRDDHQDIRTAVGAALDELRRLMHDPVDDAARQVRDTVIGLLDRLARHRQTGADLVYEAYAVDIGVGD